MSKLNEIADLLAAELAATEALNEKLADRIAKLEKAAEYKAGFIMALAGRVEELERNVKGLQIEAEITKAGSDWLGEALEARIEQAEKRLDIHGGWAAQYAREIAELKSGAALEQAVKTVKGRAKAVKDAILGAAIA